MKSTVACSIDLTAQGTQFGHLELSWSDNDHAYGIIPVPVVSIANGPGPTVLVSAGVHGDEYEGLTIARRLIAQLQGADINGRLIILPAANLPAVRAGARVSPIDHGNLNRAFDPEHPTGPTRMIADFIEQRLLPLCDFALDLHSGGKQSIYAPCGYLYQQGDRGFRAKKLAAAHAFGAPLTTCVNATSSGGSLSAAAERAKVALLATELGGGGLVDLHALEIGWRGTLNFLRHAGLLPGAATPTRTQLYAVSGRQCYVMAPIDGMFEPAMDVGAKVEAGQCAGRIWPFDDLRREPVEVVFDVGGTLLARRAMPLTRRGDTLCHTGLSLSDEEFLGP